MQTPAASGLPGNQPPSAPRKAPKSPEGAQFAMAESAELPAMPAATEAGVTGADIRAARAVVDSVASAQASGRAGETKMTIFLDFSSSMTCNNGYNIMRETLEYAATSLDDGSVTVVPFGPSSRTQCLPSQFDSLSHAASFCTYDKMNYQTFFSPYGDCIKSDDLARVMIITDGVFTDNSIFRLLSESLVAHICVVVIGSNEKIANKLREATVNCVWKNLLVLHVLNDVMEISEPLYQWLSRPQYTPKRSRNMVIVGGLLIKPDESTLTYANHIKTLLDAGVLREEELDDCSRTIMDTLRSLGPYCQQLVQKQPWFSVFNTALMKVCKNHTKSYNDFSQNDRATQEVFKKAHLAKALAASSSQAAAPVVLPWTAKSADYVVDAGTHACSESIQVVVALLCNSNKVVFTQQPSSVAMTDKNICEALQVFQGQRVRLSKPKLAMLAILLAVGRVPSVGLTEAITQDLISFATSTMNKVSEAFLQGAVLARVPSTFELMALGYASLLPNNIPDRRHHHRGVRALYMSAFVETMRHLPWQLMIEGRPNEFGHRMQVDGTVSLVRLQTHTGDPAPGFPSIVFAVCQNGSAKCFYLEQPTDTFAEDVFVCSYTKLFEQATEVLGSLSVTSEVGSALCRLFNDEPCDHFCAQIVGHARSQLCAEWNGISGGVDLQTLKNNPVMDVPAETAARVMLVAQALAGDLGMENVMAEYIYTELERKCVVSTALQMETGQQVPPEFGVSTFLTNGVFTPNPQCADILPQVPENVNYRPLLQLAQQGVREFFAPLSVLSYVTRDECPICFEAAPLCSPCPGAPSLHRICATCLGSISSCPMCRRPYGNQHH